MDKSISERIKEGKYCIKHPGQALNFISAVDGSKKCAMCILQESEMGNDGIKDKYCQKHPGFEKLFFCEEDMKGVCEKCLNHHKGHNVNTIALKSRDLKNGFDSFKEDYINITQKWIDYYEELRDKKGSIDDKIETTIDKIESIFN
jgi:hypothetical protein